MDFEQSLVHELQAITGLNGKVFPSNTEENTEPPFVVYVSSAGEPVLSLTGATNITELTCAIHVFAETYEQLKQYSRSVLNRVNSFFQRQIGIDGVFIKSITHTEPIEELDKNTNYHSSSFDIRIRF